MKKPFAYVTAVWQGGEFTVIDQATVYCRKVYEAGFTPLCPVLYLPHFLRDSVPAEHKDGIDIGREFLRRSPPRYLVFFKSRDADALTAAFQEYSGKVVKKHEQEKPSIRKQLVKLQEAVKEMAKSLSRNKHQEVDR